MKNALSRCAVGAALVAFAGAGQAQISQYSEDFEGLNAANPTELGDAGWLVGANVFDSTGTTFLYNYFAFAAPNGGPAFSAIDSGQGGPAQGAQQLSVYNDYNNADHGNGSGNRIEANVFREYTIDASNAGTWSFSFDAKLGNLAGASTAFAFIKILDPNAGFAQTGGDIIDLTNTSTEWQGYTLSADVDASQAGQIFQIGFFSVASNFESSGVFYDNLNLVPTPAAAGLLGMGGLIAMRRRR
ncbi:MAG: VPLPA-CTERM sorting domain-containing protein [Planctomycetota bacterium]